jgi:Calx-beta domain
MRRFWKRGRSRSELEDELRARRSDPPEDFLRTVANRVRRDERRLRPRFSVSPAYGMAAVAVAVVIAAGGSGLVKSGVSGANRVFGQLTSSTSPTTTVTSSPADRQYKKVCGSNPRPAKCEVSIYNTAAFEPKSGSTHAYFPVAMATASDQTVTATYIAQNGTATAPEDYATTFGTITFLPGQTITAISVPVPHDTGTTTEYFKMVLTGVSSNAVIVAGTATATIYQP